MHLIKLVSDPLLLYIVLYPKYIKPEDPLLRHQVGNIQNLQEEYGHQKVLAFDK